jgi:hypothetical protein
MQIVRIKHSWQQIVWYSAIQHRDVGFKKASMTITCVIKDKRSIQDTDNLLSGLKSTTDLLTARVRGANKKTGNPGVEGLGIIVDDSPECLEIKMPIIWEINREKAPMLILKMLESGEAKE